MALKNHRISLFFLISPSLVIWLLLTKERKLQFKPIKINTFIEQVAKNNSKNNINHPKIHKIFQMKCFVLTTGSPKKNFDC